MKVLSCPECFNVSSVEGKGIHLEAAHAFERRGKIRRRPVFKCDKCDAILVVRTKLFGNPEAQAVDDDTWVAMESAWQTQMEAHASRDADFSIARSKERRQKQRAQRAREQGRAEECPYCGKYLKNEAGLEAHIAAIHPSEG